MEKDLIFFGENGLTQTSANHVANLCKERYNAMERALNNIVFYTTKVKLLGSSDESLIQEGTTSIAHVESYLKSISKYKSLISWLREAIKAKERLIKEAQNGSYEYYGISLPEEPKREDYITADDVVASMGIKERNRYYYLEAFCATIGEYIHPNGTFARQRTALHDVIHHPNEVNGNGRDTIIYSRMPSIAADTVEYTFMSLQNTYREYQAELNSIKYKIEDTVNKDTAKKNIEYSEKYNLYNTQMGACGAELTAKRKEAVTVASNLKIIIPDALKDIYEEVKELGKDK